VLHTQAVRRPATDATARVRDLIVVSRHARGFADPGVRVYDPWTDKSLRMDLA
jgi:hypothetical protein